MYNVLDIYECFYFLKCCKDSFFKINCFLFMQEGTDVHAAVLQKESEYKQPYLLSIGREAKNPSQFFLVLDRLVIPGGLDIVPAFDRLFKAHYVFSANYSPVLQNFWEFIDCSVYSVMKPLEAKAKVRDMASAIRDAMTKK